MTKKPKIRTKREKYLGKLAKQELARLEFSSYVTYVHHGNYTHARHTEFMCGKLQQVESGEIKRLMVFLPPRHSKSETITSTFPSWYIGRNPDRRVILTSYADELARRFALRNREKVLEYGTELFDIQISDVQSVKSNWEIKGRLGGLLSAGVGGGISGHGASLLVIDDPVKNAEQANSLTYRNKVYDEFTRTLTTRLSPNGAIILVMTRWHDDDLAGRILSHEPEKWEVINLPAFCEDENDPIGRKIGEPLWAEFGFDKKYLDDRKNAIGSRAFNSLYQQRPSPEIGGLFKRDNWQFYKKPPAQFDTVIASWDMAFKGTVDSDYVVGQVWGKREGEFFLLEQVRQQMSFPETLMAVKSLSKRYPMAYKILVEDKANGTAVIATLRRQIPGLIPVNPQGGKESRAQAGSALCRIRQRVFTRPR